MWWLFLTAMMVVFIILANGSSYGQQVKPAGVRLKSLFKLWGDNTYSVLLVIFILVFIAFGFFFPWFFYSFIHSLYMDIESQISSVTINSSAFRNVSLSIAGSVTLAIAALGLILTFIRNLLTRQQNRTDEQRLVTEQISRAIEQIGAYKQSANDKILEPNIEVRLGGLYSLQRIMQDSLKDQESIAKILYAYVRENAKRPKTEQLIRSMQDDRETYQLPEDIQAAISIICRFSQGQKKHNKERLTDSQLNFSRVNFKNYYLTDIDFSFVNLQYADFTDADFTYANLSGANLSGAILVDTEMSGANLSGADLRDTNLRNQVLHYADLSGAKLLYADLFGANLFGANLRDANLFNANLRDANLADANLAGANLACANLSQIIGLTQEQVNSTRGNEETLLPLELIRPPHWRK